MARRYKKVPQNENENEDDVGLGAATAGGDGEDESKKQSAERLEQITIKVHALFWVFIAGGLAYYLDIIDVALKNPKVDRMYLNLAVITFMANICIVIYLTIWLPIVQKVTIPWDIYCPRMIPTATFLGVVCLLSLVISFWPVWGFFSPLFITIFFLGLIFGTHFIPWPC